jgi:hypothetical protein
MKSGEAGAQDIGSEETTTPPQANDYMVQKMKCDGPDQAPGWITTADIYPQAKCNNLDH